VADMHSLAVTVQLLNNH